MNRFILFFLLVSLVSCKGTTTKELDGAEIIFYEDGRTSAYISEEIFENTEANRLNTEGVKLAKYGDFEKAKIIFQNGLNIEPNNPSLLNNLGNTEHELKHYKQAIALFEESFKVSDSTYLNSALNLGLLYWKDYEFNKSAKILEYVLSKSNKKYEIAFAQLQLARTYLDMNACAKARKAFLQANEEWNEISGFKKKLVNLEEEIKNCINYN